MKAFFAFIELQTKTVSVLAFLLGNLDKVLQLFARKP